MKFFRMTLKTPAVPLFLLQKKISERMVSDMKKENALLSSISILIGAVIAILALARGKWQMGLLIAVFALWGIWAAIVLLRPRIQASKRRKRLQKQRQRLQASGISQSGTFEVPTITPDPVEQVLLRHVNHRISSYLKSTYGEVTWEWCEKNPAHLAVKGGVGRIRVYGIEDANYADVRMDKNAGISFDLIRIIKTPDSKKENTSGKMPPNKQPIDPQIWYETQGRKVLESMVADLNSRGHSHLVLHENGDISITQDQKDIVKDHLNHFPAMAYWPRLVQVLESEGLAAEVADQKLIVSW